MNLSRNVLLLSMVLLLAVPQASSSSIWRETDKGPDELASQYVRSASNVGPTNTARSSFERSSDIVVPDNKGVRRQVKAGKKGKKSILPEVFAPSIADSCGVAESPRACSATPVEVEIGDCTDCVDEELTVAKVDKLRTAPTSTCAAVGYNLLGTVDANTFAAPCLSDYLQEAAKFKTEADGGVGGTTQDAYEDAMVDFCVHQCGQDYWEGLAEALENTDETFILDTCKDNYPFKRYITSCTGSQPCVGTETTAIGVGSCKSNYACKSNTYSTIGEASCLGAKSCYLMSNSNVGDESCTEENSCERMLKSTIGEASCVGGHHACKELKYAIVDDGSCDGVNACSGSEGTSELSLTIGTGSCVGANACSGSTGTDATDTDPAASLTVGTGSCLKEDACKNVKPVDIGNDSCTKKGSCTDIDVDVGAGSCTVEDICNCPEVRTKFAVADYPEGIPAGECIGDTGTDDEACCTA
jgi:hypothetical protein